MFLTRHHGYGWLIPPVIFSQHLFGKPFIFKFKKKQCLTETLDRAVNTLPTDTQTFILIPLLSETLHVYSWRDAYWKWTLHYGMELIFWLIWGSDKRDVFIHEISPHVCFLTVIALLLIVSCMAWPYFDAFFVINDFAIQYLSVSHVFQLYKNLWSTVMQGKNVLERPSWWAEFCSDKPAVGSLRAKL